MLLLNRDDVEALVDLDDLRAAVAAAMVDLSDGRADAPARIAARVGARSMLAAMPASVPSIGALTTKLVSLFPDNVDRPTHQALICCFDPENGTPLAVMDGSYITEARTAAASAVATSLLARADSRRLAVLGTGAQADAHARAIVRVRPIEEILVAGRAVAKTAALAARLEEELEIPAVVGGSFDEAVAAADIVCACTHSPDPVVTSSAIVPGIHITSVGYNTAGREVAPEVVAAARVVVESVEAALADPPAGSNDLIWPIRDGIITRAHVDTELGDLVSGRRQGRTGRDDVTLYKSVGVAVQDAAAAALVLRAAAETGRGIDFPL